MTERQREAWLVTGGKVFRDRAYISKEGAERAAGDRDDGSIVIRMIPALSHAEGEAEKISVLRGELVRERDYRLRAEAQVDYLKHRLGDEHASVWYWQGDGYDNLDSLVSSVTVAIRADDLRHQLGTPQVAVPEKVRELIGAVRSVNRSRQHSIHIEGDDEPCFWQRAEWVRYVLELADEAEQTITAAPTAPAREPISSDDLVPVPRGLLGAACSAICRTGPSDKVLAELRRYTTGDLSRPTAPAGDLRPDCSVCGDFGSDCDVCGAPSRQPSRNPCQLGDRVLMPKRLTAENGAKGALHGEFFVTVGSECVQCGSLDFSDDQDECGACGHNECLPDRRAVPWNTIKRIYARAVEFLGVPAPDEREIAALREDAERYRFWREVLAGDEKAAMDLFEEELNRDVSSGARPPTGEELDKAVDAARRLRAGKEGEPS